MDATLTDITDAQAAEIMLTLPWNFGDLNEDGEACYSDGEIQSVIKYVRKINARAEAAEADAAECRAERARYGDMMTSKLAAAEAEVARLRELLNDRESDLLYEATGRHTAEDALDKVRQALGVPAPISVVDEAARIVLENNEANAEVTRLQALMAEAVQADLDDDAYALEAAIVKMADALDDNGQDAQGG